MPAGRPSPLQRGRWGHAAAARVRQTTTGRPVLSARAGAVLGVFVILVTILAIPLKAWITQRAHISELETQVAEMDSKVSTLRGTLQQWNDPAYVEAQARARLHFVKPGEVGYVVITDADTASEEPTRTHRLVEPPTGVPWWGAVWSTVRQVADPKANGIQESAPAPAAPAPSYGE
jgi:cell division protein FtsB